MLAHSLFMSHICKLKNIFSIKHNKPVELQEMYVRTDAIEFVGHCCVTMFSIKL